MPKPNSKISLEALFHDYFNSVYGNTVDRKSEQFRQVRMAFFAGATVILQTIELSQSIILDADKAKQQEAADKLCQHLNTLYQECCEVFEQAERDFKERN